MHAQSATILRPLPDRRLPALHSPPTHSLRQRFERTIKERPLPGFLAGVGVNAHNHLPVCRPLLDGGRGGGEGSVRHLCDTWVQHALEVGQGGKGAAAAAPRANGDTICLSYPLRPPAPAQLLGFPRCKSELSDLWQHQQQSDASSSEPGASFLDAREPTPPPPDQRAEVRGAQKCGAKCESLPMVSAC